MGVVRSRVFIPMVIVLGSWEFLAHGQRPQAGKSEIAVAVARSKTETVTHHYKCMSYGQFYTEIRAPADGHLAELFAEEGQAVKEGDPLFMTRPPKDGEDSRAIDRGRASSADAGTAASGGDPMFRLVPTDGMEKPKADDPDHVSFIRAPCGGLVGRLARRPGSVVGKDDLLTTVVRTGVIEARFNVPERDYLESAASWSSGQESRRIALTLADRSVFPHAAESCQALAGGGAVGDIRFSAKFPNPGGQLRGGRGGTVTVSREWKDAIFLPREASSSDGQRSYVFVVDEGRVARRREIVVRDGTDDLLVVQGGVAAGDRIVVGGASQVHEGDAVE